MPITKSAKKSLRKSLRRKKGNVKKRDKLKKLLKEVRGLIAEKKSEEANKFLPQIYKVLDKAAKIGLIKKNTASRTKSRITRTINRA
jgi:small subunit ribosomal protein S20